MNFICPADRNSGGSGASDLPSGYSVCVRPVQSWSFLALVGFIFLLSGGLVFIHEDAVAVTFEILVLTAPDGPDQYGDEDQSEEDHAGDEAVDDVHGFTVY